MPESLSTRCCGCRRAQRRRRLAVSRASRCRLKSSARLLSRGSLRCARHSTCLTRTATAASLLTIWRCRCGTCLSHAPSRGVCTAAALRARKTCAAQREVVAAARRAARQHAARARRSRAQRRATAAATVASTSRSSARCSCCCRRTSSWWTIGCRRARVATSTPRSRRTTCTMPTSHRGATSSPARSPARRRARSRRRWKRCDWRS
mmetsp:Transcript_41255/g.123167  ORF Transcript_41255/g.123167 Transcript_41255/m.123167 type:complete len:207 (-) Transcript_41255:1390-2010(-)